MAFLLLIVYLVLTFLRPAELYPQLAPLQIMNRAFMICALATLGALALGRRVSLRLPQPYLVVAFLLWCMLSTVLAQRWLGGIGAPFDVLMPSVSLFLLLYLNLDSQPRLRIACLVLGALGVIVAAQAVYSYHTHWRAQKFLLRTLESESDQDVSEDSEENAWPEGDEQVVATQEPASDEETDSEAGAQKPAYTIRVRSLGFLNDPNDLAQALVSFLPLVLALRRPSRRVWNLMAVWLPSAGLLYAVALTQSRGAIVALAALCFLALQPKLGRTASLVIGVLGGVAAVRLGFTGGRSMSVDESAAGRLDAWAQGLEMLKGSPIWGVGQGLFTEHHPLVAHNSFVHCFAETGLVGYFLWLSMIVLTLFGLRRIEKAENPGGPDIRPLAHAARLALTAFLVAAFFLSRSYGAVLFLLLGLGAAVCDVARRDGFGTPIPAIQRWVPAVAVLAGGSVIGFWVLMKALAR